MVAGVGTVMYIMGYGFADVAWVTKATFNKTHDALSASVDSVKEKIDSAQKMLWAKISEVEASVDRCREGVERKVEEEVGAVRKRHRRRGGPFGRGAQPP